MKDLKNVDEYIADFPAEVQSRLEDMRATISAVAPHADETIAYGMPAYKLNGPLVYFAGFKNHVGFYATPTGHTEFSAELANYKQGKGSVQFPHSEPLPLDLVKRVVEFRVAENKLKTKKAKK